MNLYVLLHLHPPSKSNSGEDIELDSYSFQTVTCRMTSAIAECIGVPIFQQEISGSSVYTDMQYQYTKDDEVEDLFALLSKVKQQFPSVQGVSAGALFSEYQRNRVNHVCGRLDMVGLYPIWQTPQSQLVNDMIDLGLEAVIVKVASLGLNQKHLMKHLDDVLPHLCDLESKFGINVAGEGGEFETLSLFCPGLYKRRIVVDEYEVVVHSDDFSAPVCYVVIKKFHLEDVL
ncbi:hypothetical protein GEMRC1_009392 [Eukaryota sp. GEM-RC1]